MSDSVHLYEVKTNVQCLSCRNKGAVQSYGVWHDRGLGNKVDQFELEAIKRVMEKHRHTPYMSHTMGFGGTIPWVCLNCGNIGLIDIDGFEGYNKAFETIKENE